jgi:hypothetical protein
MSTTAATATSTTSSKSSKPSKVPEGPPRRIREGVNEWKVQGTKFQIDERYRIIKAVSCAPDAQYWLLGTRACVGARTAPTSATLTWRLPQIGHGAYGVVV